MRVVRLKHKTGIAILVVVVLILLFVLISRHSKPEIELGGDDFNIRYMPTRTFDFINIAKNVPVETDGKDETKQDTVRNTPLARGKLKHTFRKQPRPPKRRISDGIVDKGVLKSIVRGDALLGPSKGSSHHQKHKVIPLVSNHNDKKGIKMPKLPMQDISYTIGVVVISCNRPDAITRSLTSLLKYRPSAQQFPIVVSQDCGHQETSKAISVFGDKVRHIKQPDLSEPNVPANMRHFTGYYKISRHFKWALGQMFDEMGYDTVLIVEDDLDIAPDFYDYFLGTRHLLDKDPTIWCVSAWNDNGKAGLIEPHENGKLYRSDFFPGLGWMMTKKLWQELGPKWPAGFWDDWVREPDQRKDRVCIRPEISRTKTFGRIGVSQGQFFDQHLKFIVLNDKKFDFLHADLSYLIKDKYDAEFLSKIKTLPVFSIDDIIARKTDKHVVVRVNYWTESTFNRVASRLGVMLDFKAGVPRAGYHGIVTAMYRGIRIYITPKK